MHFQQSTRPARLTTVLAKDELVLLRMSGSEYVNSLFSFRVEALSVNPDIDLHALIGTHATIEIDEHEHGPQPMDGIVTQARFVGTGETDWRYDIELQPWFSLTKLRRNQRIFHNKSVVQILEELLQDYSGLGSPAVEVRLDKEYPKLEYTVQFCESDFDFACRMMERFGISYYFTHDMGSHTLILTDSFAGFDDVPGLKRPYKRPDSDMDAQIERFMEWRPERNMTTGAIRLVDYNFKFPGARMEASTIGDADYANGETESFDWPGRYLDLGRAESVEVGLRTEQERGQDRRHYAEGDCVTLRAGRKVQLSGDPIHGATGEVFACLGATHNFNSAYYGSTEKSGEPEIMYDGAYTLIPLDSPLAPRRKTELARVRGPQTARVVGDGEIDCDEYGRILVRFHWDIHDQYSMRCRVSQNWSGNGWGGMVIPRIGMEVLVEFLDGDPDQPLVTGCVYNGKNAVPYELPANKTRSTFKTDTHQGRGFNELRFEDKRDAEEIFIHAQKDRNEKTLHNHTERIDNNWVQSVGHNKAIEVHNNHDEVIGGNMTLSVGPSSIGQIISSTVGKLTEGISSIGSSLGLPGLLNPGEGNQTITIEKNKGETVGIASMEAVGVAKMTSVGKTYHINVGTKMVITCGKSQISIDKSGYVKITGTRFNFSASGPVQINGKDIDLN
ncbi:MAG: type VI secretion system tip protein TssI/VgrG [Pseudomonadota bacterium]